MTNNDDEPIGSAVIGEAPQEGWTPVGDDEPLDLAAPVDLEEVELSGEELRAAQERPAPSDAAEEV